jgi:hypothetical protein
LFVKFQGQWPQIVDMRLVKALSMTARHSQQPGDRFFTPLHPTRRGAHATAFVEMIDDVRSFGLRELAIAQGAPTALGKCFTAGTTAQQPNAITAVYLANHEMALTRVTKLVACRIHTGESAQVRSFHAVLLW